MGSDGTNPWKTSSSSQHKDKKSQDSHNFPPLNAKGPSKAQRRIRAFYNQSATFEPYPPRVEQLNRQERSRLDYSNYHDEDFEENDSWLGDNGPSYDHAQRSGISSITFYSEDGQRLSRGPDIYRRNTTTVRHGIEREKQIHHTPERQRDRVEINATQSTCAPLPSPFTDKKLDSLIREYERRQRIRAVEDRLGREDEDQNRASTSLKEEIIKALSSQDGFMAAFGKESIEKEHQRKATR